MERKKDLQKGKQSVKKTEGRERLAEGKGLLKMDRSINSKIEGEGKCR